MATLVAFAYPVSPTVYTRKYSSYSGLKAETMFHTQIFLLLKCTADYIAQIYDFTTQWWLSSLIQEISWFNHKNKVIALGSNGVE